MLVNDYVFPEVIRGTVDADYEIPRIRDLSRVTCSAPRGRKPYNWAIQGGRVTLLVGGAGGRHEERRRGMSTSSTHLWSSVLYPPPIMITAGVCSTSANSEARLRHGVELGYSLNFGDLHREVDRPNRRLSGEIWQQIKTCLRL